MQAFIVLILIALLGVGACDRSDDNHPTGEDWPSDSVRVLKSGLQYPWEILWGKDDHIWMTERGGKISRIDPKTGETVFSATISDVVSRGEGGMLGMVQDPGFLQNGFLYVAYNYNGANGYREKLVRLRFANNALLDATILLEDIPAANVHNGSRLWIEGSADPKLFMTTGDAANQPSAQDINSPSGKVLRLNLDGSIPADNPVSGNPAWSLGHRNPQGLVVANGIMYSSEHGPNIEDEVNIVERARNYGWPTVNGPCSGGEVSFCTANNIREPIWSSGSRTVAACGMDYYNHDRIAEWKNSLLMTTLKDATLYRHQLSSDGQRITGSSTYFEDEWGRLRDVCVSPAGRVYICTSNGNNNDVLVEISNLD